MNRPKSWGVLPTGSASSLDNRSWVSGCFNMAATSVLILDTIHGYPETQ
jgi:hypothetical protein